jgi:hemoglobin
MRTLLVALALVAGCGGTSKPDTAGTTGGDTGSAAVDNRSLFDRLGGLPAITAVVKEFVKTTGSDPRIAQFFTNADIPRLEQLMVDQICEATGGPCKYTGKSMKESHTGMKVREEHFTAFIEDLTATLDKFEVGEREKAEVLAAFNSMKADVVEPAP